MTAATTRWILLLLIVLTAVVVIVLLARRPWQGTSSAIPFELPTVDRTAVVLDLHFDATATGFKLSASAPRTVKAHAQRLIAGRGEWTIELTSNAGERQDFAMMDPGRVEFVDAIGTPGAAVEQLPQFDWQIVLPIEALTNLEGISHLRVADKNDDTIGAFLLQLAPDGSIQVSDEGSPTQESAPVSSTQESAPVRSTQESASASATVEVAATKGTPAR
jgi:hypothetical protein